MYFEDIGQLSLTSDEWTLVSYFKMSSYWQQAETIKEILQQMETYLLCRQVHPRTYCEANMQQFQYDSR